MRAGHLFAGIGGFALAAQWAGIENVWSNEIDPFCCKVLRKNFKHKIIEDDIRNIGKHNLEPVDILTGGFPCQPFSQSGKRKGTADNRYLWPEMLRIIGEIQPSFVVGENVRGLTNWNGGMVFDKVQADLETEGYEVTPFLLPACAVGAPHRRDRIWFIAHAISERTWESSRGFYQSRKLFQKAEREEDKQFNKSLSKSRTVADTKTRRLSRRNEEQLGESKENADDKQLCGIPEWSNFPTQSPVRFRDDGVSYELDGITFPKWCQESIKAAGNAIVPQVAFEIFKAIISIGIKET